MGLLALAQEENTIDIYPDSHMRSADCLIIRFFYVTIVIVSNMNLLILRHNLCT